MGLFQTADREMAESKMGEVEASLKKKQKKIQVGRCDSLMLYKLPFDTLSEYLEPWLQQTRVVGTFQL